MYKAAVRVLIPRSIRARNEGRVEPNFAMFHPARLAGLDNATSTG